jgi:hypothetical protein
VGEVKQGANGAGNQQSHCRYAPLGLFIKVEQVTVLDSCKNELAFLPARV